MIVLWHSRSSVTQFEIGGWAQRCAFLSLSPSVSCNWWYSTATNGLGFSSTTVLRPAPMPLACWARQPLRAATALTEAAAAAATAALRDVTRWQQQTKSRAAKAERKLIRPYIAKLRLACRWASIDAYRWTGSGRLCELSYSSTTMYGLQQQTNAIKMMNTVFTWRIVFIVAMKRASVISCRKIENTVNSPIIIYGESQKKRIPVTCPDNSNNAVKNQ